MKAVTGSLLIAAMLVLFWRASQTASLPLAILWFLLGAALGTIGLLWLTPTLARWCGYGDGMGGVMFDAPKKRAFAFAATAMAAGAILVGLAVETTPLVVVGVAVATVAAGFIDIQVDQGDVPVPRFWLAAGTLMMIVGVFVAMTGIELPVGIGNGGVALAFLGFPVLKVGLPRALSGADDEWSRRVAIAVKLVSAAAIGIGAALLIVGAVKSDPAWPWVGLGFSFISLGYALVVEIGLRLWPSDIGEGAAPDPKPIKRRALRLMAVGLVLLALGYFFALQLTVTLESYAALLMVAAFAVGMFFALRGEAGLFVFAVGFVLIWVTWERTTIEQVMDPVEANVVIGLGDSYMAGQGANRFFEYNNTSMPLRIIDDGAQDPEPTKAPFVDGGSECRRSPQALPARTAARYGSDWAAINLACSGAKIGDVHRVVQYPHGDRATDDGRAYPGTLEQLSELADLDEGVRDRVRLVMVSIGGNDSGFSKVIAACLLPTDCTGQVKSLEDQVPMALADLDEVYRAVLDAVAGLGGNEPPRVVVIPYPEFLDDQQCGLTLSAAERDSVLTFQRTLNAEIIGRATAVGIDVFEAGQHVYTNGLKLCDNGGRGETVGANFLYLMPHDPLGGLSPARWVQGSMHPRPEGHDRMAEAFVCTDTGGTDCVTIDPPAIDAPDVEPADESIDAWTSRNIRRSVTQVAGALALIMGGGLLLALGLFHRTGRWLNDGNWFNAVFPRP